MPTPTATDHGLALAFLWLGPIYEIIADPLYEIIAETKLDDRGDGNAVSRWLPSYYELVGIPYAVGWLYVEVLTDYEIWWRAFQ